MEHLVSICIPCYNAGETIKETIQSLINQTYSDFEVIISDNHSTDNTIEIIKSFHDDRIKIFENESNLGVIQNYHLALSRATGKYVKLLCADDIITPDCIEKQVNVFLSHPNNNIVMVAAEKHVINKDNKILFRKPFPGKAGLYDGKKAIKKSFLHGTSIFGEPGCVMFDRECSKKTSEFIIDPSLTYIIEFDFYCQLLQYGNLFVIKEPLFSFRVINTSGTAGFRWSQARIFNSLIDKYHKEGVINYSWFTRTYCKTMAWIMCIARNLVFKFA